MKKQLSILLCLILALGFWPAGFSVSADMVLSDRYILETENMDLADIDYYAGANQDYFDYGNGVSGSYIRVENTVGTVGNFIEFHMQIQQAGRYDLSYVYRLHPTSGVNQLYINGSPAGEPRDFNDRAYGSENDMVTFQVKDIPLDEGENILRLETTALSATGGDRITVDYILLASTDRQVVGYEEEVVFVSDMDYFDLKQYAQPDHIGMNFQSGGTLVFDQCTCKKQPIMLDGVEYTKGFGLEPNDQTAAVLEIPIPEGAERFRTAVGINDHKEGSSYDQQNVITFYIDGQQVYETERLTFGHCESVELLIPYGAQTLAIRNDCGTSSVNDHICFGDARFEIGAGSDVSLTDYSIPGGRTLADGHQIYVLMPAGTDLSSLVPSFSINQAATCDRSAGAAHDFTQPVAYTVTSQNGQTAVYTVTVYVERELTDDEREAVEQVQALIGLLSDHPSMSDRQAAADARAAFDRLDGLEKLSVSNYQDLLNAEAVIQDLLDRPIRISCVGDSITWGGVAEKSYPVNLQELLGDDYRVYNGGVGGTTVCKNGNYPYWSTTSYERSKAFQPDYVLLMLGTNDAQVANWENCKNNIEADFRALIQEYASLESDPVIVLASPAWYYLDPESARYTAINVTISDLVERLAQEYGFTFVDINAVTANHPEWFERDGIHPDDRGYAAIAQAFAQVFEGESDAALHAASLDDAPLYDFSKDRSGTVTIDRAADAQRVVLQADGNVESVSSVRGPITSLAITVTSSNGRYKKDYSLTLIGKDGRGDLDLDGEVTIADVMEACKIMARESTGTPPAIEELVLGNLDGDDGITIADVMEICKILARKP